MVPSTGSLSFDLVLGFVGLLLVLQLHVVRRAKRIPEGLRLPPGPRGRPLVGNLYDMPSHHAWETYMHWAKEYGDLIHVKVFGQDIVIVNSEEVSRDLFDARSSIYSDRPQFIMLSELIGINWTFSRMPYGPRWRQHRRVFHQHFHPKAAAAFHDVQIKRTRVLLQNLHETPSEFIRHLRHFSGGTIIEIVYGFEVLPKGDPYIEISEKSVEAAVEAGDAGAFLVDNLPILKYVPEWVPGADFRRKARIWRETILGMAVVPFQAVKEALSAGTARPSVTASLLNNLPEQNDSAAYTEETVRNAAGAAYLAGSDTTLSTLSSFILAMVLHPEVQRKAQDELDSAIGTDRLPAFEDRENLPYVNAICKEVYRWRPVVPLAIAHRVTQDDVYGDYFIPGGSLVFGNAWAILHDERTYGPEPEEFRPERFLKPGIIDPAAVFGFGRRVCPGRYMADNSVFIVVASILKVFEISLAIDQHGNQIPVKPAYTSGFASYPEPFQCTIRSRSASSEAFLLQCVED